MSLMLKGLSPGIAFVLLMAGPAANFASIMILNRSHGKRATAIYVGSVIATHNESDNEPFAYAGNHVDQPIAHGFSYAA